MALYFLDTSALVKLYIREPGTERLLRLTRRGSDHRFAILGLAAVEFHSAVRRRQRQGDIASVTADRVLGRFDQHLESRFLKQPMTDAQIDLATSLVDRQTLRAYDAVQLAGCLILQTGSGGEETTFTCADEQLLQAAALEGLSCLNPEAS